MEFYPFQTEDVDKLEKQAAALIGSEMGHVDIRRWVKV